MVAGVVHDRTAARIRRDQDKGQAWPVAARAAVGALFELRRRHVIVVTARIVPGDDDRRIVPVFAAGDRVDEGGDEGFSDLRVGIAGTGMIVVAAIAGLNVRIRIGRFPAEVVDRGTLEIEDPAIGERARRQSMQRVVDVVHVTPEDVVLPEITEVLRPVVVRFIAG